MKAGGPALRVVALIASYNEERFIGRAVRHLFEQGVESYVIDNDSTDGTLRVLERLVGRGVVGFETLPRGELFEFAPILRRKEALHRELGADWYLHYDPDTICEAPRPYASLAEGIRAVDAAGDNAINFEEFVFMPTSREENFDHERYFEEMQHYFYFHRRPLFRVNAWKNFGQDIDLVTSGGHWVSFDGRRVHPEGFIMRHYIVLSYEHAVRKYCEKRYSKEEIMRGWHGPRASLRPRDIAFPRKERLKKVSMDGSWDMSDPWTEEPLFMQARDPRPWRRPPGAFRKLLRSSNALAKSALIRIPVLRRLLR